MDMINKNIINCLFSLMILFLPFNNVPESIRVSFVGGILGNKLLFYPFVFFLIYTIYIQCKYRKLFFNLKIFKKYIYVYAFITCISLMIGLYNYPYYNLVLSGPIEQIEKLPKVIRFLNDFEVYVDENLLTIIWMTLSRIKDLFLEILYTFGGAYMIYCWYYDDWKRGFNILVNSLIVSSFIFYIYNYIELFYLAGNINAENILKNITPYIHIINWNNTWYPTILSIGQMRSVFSEPSFYGIFFSFAMPYYYYYYFSTRNFCRKLLIIITIIFFIFCLFITQSRTSIALFFGEQILFIIFVLYLNKKDIYKKSFVIFMCSVFAFLTSNFYIDNILKDNIYKVNDVSSYIEQNLLSINSKSQRSNAARYSMTIADLKIGLDNYLIGVGYNLRDAYIPDYLTQESKENREIQMWLETRRKWGILKAGYARLNEYAVRFAETGLIGLILFFLPIFILIKKCLRNIFREKKVSDKLPFIFFIISFIGIIVSGFSMALNVFYIFWVLLGLGYAMCFGKENKEQDI